MKTLCMTILGIAALLCTPAATAQTATEKALPDFIAANAGSNILFKNRETIDDHGKSCIYNRYVFRVKKNDASLEKLRKAFSQDEPEAYSVFNRVKGSGNTETIRIGYGLYPANTSTSVTFGSYEDRNYLVQLYYDKADAEWRTCYALCWYDDPDEAKCYKGVVYKIYSRNPLAQSVENKKQSVEVLDDGTLLQLDNLTGDLRMLNTGSTFDGISKIKSASDFVTRLSNLRTMYNAECKKSYNKRSNEQITGIVNVTLSMCKQNAGLLDSDEKRVCVGLLRDMQRNTSDNSTKDLLDLAVKYLK